MDLEERINLSLHWIKRCQAMLFEMVWNVRSNVARAEPLKGYEFKKLGELQRPKNEVIMGE